jgi:hypothetical protein
MNILDDFGLRQSTQRYPSQNDQTICAEGAESFCRRYSRRWQIENEYKSMKNDFLGKPLQKITVFGCSIKQPIITHTY